MSPSARLGASVVFFVAACLASAVPAGAVDSPAVLAGVPFSCSALGGSAWTTTSNTFEPVVQCRMKIPAAGSVLISASSSVALQDTDYEGWFSVGVDSTIGIPASYRWVNVYTDTGDGTDESVAISQVVPITAGLHTFYLLGARYNGAGTVRLYDPSIVVTYVPAGSAQLALCGDSSSNSWATTSSTFQLVRTCGLDLPSAGWVLVSADGSAGRTDGPYEAQFRLDVDAVAGDPEVDRWVNVYDDTGDGTDRTVALSRMYYLTAGHHDVNLLAKRYAGTASVYLNTEAVTALFLADVAGAPAHCDVPGNQLWTTAATSFQTVDQCTVTASFPTAAVVLADASVGYQDAPFEARFELDLDHAGGSSSLDRWINVYADTGDGTDVSMRTNTVRRVGRGAHDVTLLADRYNGAGTVRLYDPVLAVYQTYWTLFVDGFDSGDTSAWSAAVP
jgi:hypothetical protein